jgi:hypothetical protein
MTGWIVWSGKVRSGWPRRKDRHHCQGLSESIQPSRGGRFGGWTTTGGGSTKVDQLHQGFGAGVGRPVQQHSLLLGELP